MVEFSFLSAIVVGLFGAGHCIGMCGGIMTSFALTIPNYQQFSFWQKLPYLLAYNLGRISSYMVAGALVAGSSQLLSQSRFFNPVYLQIFSAVMLFLMGLYIANISGLLTRLESVGKHIWRFISPLTKKLLPIKSPLLAIPFGMLWGWLPCGLVYSMLTWSLASGDVYQGTLIMLGFGLGTMPALLLAGTAASSFKEQIQKPLIRKFVGFMIIIYSQWLLVMAIIKLIG